MATDLRNPALPKGQPLLAWLVIVAVVAFVAIRTLQSSRKENPTVRQVGWLLQGRYLVGMAHLGVPSASMYKQAKAYLEQGSYGQRLRLAVLAGELAGTEEQAKVLKQLFLDGEANEILPGENEAHLANLLSLLQSKGLKALNDEDRKELLNGLGWFGKLALASADQGDQHERDRLLAGARRTALAQLGQGIAIIVGGLTGLALIFIFAILAYSGRLLSGMDLGRPGGIYAETFAVYLVLYLGFSFVARLLPAAIPSLTINGFVIIGSMAAVFWPLFRGYSWSQVRQDLGWTAGRQPWLEPLLGVVCYVATLPLLIAGVLAMFGLMYLQRRLGGSADPLGPGAPTHPILGLALQADAWVWIQVALLACVLAPLVEETMFRGALYRHLREWLPGPWGVAAAALISGFLFAAIHPQGWLAVPVLMALAVGFALAREWRGSLIAPMVGHALNNASVTLVLFLATS
jgi:membrane protease YdiL (CAAX protease family)